MKIPEIKNDLCRFIEKEILNDDSIAINDDTLLLEWGILDSLKMTELVAFIEQNFKITLMPDDISPKHFKNLESISKLISERTSEDRHVAA